jgi:hypothetical protein
MKGETILTAYTKACADTLNEKEWRQRDAFEAELKRRLAAYDEAMDARVAERFMSQAMNAAVTDFDYFTAVVNRINLDAATIKSQKAEIADLKAQLKSAWQTDAP